ncbi:hypothetical protein ADJ79_05150 [Ottowia sp. oral taxon 894]|nr:hypothetical protein ADJ79_05150 [Ottowia sp. oral taxon 894]
MRHGRSARLPPRRWRRKAGECAQRGSSAGDFRAWNLARSGRKAAARGARRRAGGPCAAAEKRAACARCAWVCERLPAHERPVPAAFGGRQAGGQRPSRLPPRRCGAGAMPWPLMAALQNLSNACNACNACLWAWAPKRGLGRPAGRVALATLAWAAGRRWMWRAPQFSSSIHSMRS